MVEEQKITLDTAPPPPPPAETLAPPPAKTPAPALAPAETPAAPAPAPAPAPEKTSDDSKALAIVESKSSLSVRTYGLCSMMIFCFDDELGGNFFFIV